MLLRWLETFRYFSQLHFCTIYITSRICDCITRSCTRVVSKHILAVTDPFCINRGIFHNHSCKTERCSILFYPACKLKSIPDRILRFYSCCSLIKNLTFNFSTPCTIKRKSYLSAAPLCIICKILCRHLFASKIISVALKILIVIPSIKIIGHTIQNFCCFTNHILFRCNIG